MILLSLAAAPSDTTFVPRVDRLFHSTELHVLMVANLHRSSLLSSWCHLGVPSPELPSPGAVGGCRLEPGSTWPSSCQAEPYRYSGSSY